MREISVVVPVYNVEKYIEKCIDSILEQSFNDFELILINDGSTDKSGYICDLYSKQDYRVKVIHKENSGVSATRNLGINVAKGEYIQFIDPDDWIERDLLKAVYEKIKYDKSDIVFCGIKREILKIKKSIEKVASEKLISEININRNHDAIKLMEEDLFGFTWCKLFKLSIIKKNNILFDEKLSLAEDEKFTCDYYSYVNKVSVIREAYYHYVIYGDERRTLCTTKVNNILNKDCIFNSWIKFLSIEESDVVTKKFLNDRSFYSLYEEVWNICYSNIELKEKRNKIEELKKTKLYKYLIRNNNNIDKYIFVMLTKYKLVYLFKVYNKIRYSFKSKNKLL